MTTPAPRMPQGDFPATLYGSRVTEPVAGLRARSVYGAVKTSSKAGIERRCGYQPCGRMFTQRNPSGAARFCSSACKNRYWADAGAIGDRVLQGQFLVTGKSQATAVLEVLRASSGWIALSLTCPFVNLNVVSKLRKRGMNIKCRRVWSDARHRTEYEYRLSE